MTGLALAATVQVQARSALTLLDPNGGAPIGKDPGGVKLGNARPSGGKPNARVLGVLQCVPFARDMSGIRLYGDAHTWWRQAEGKYDRGRAPRPGAVMAISPHGGSALGHVATVSRIIDARTILISHANWSAPGKIERNVTAMDVSPANDWSEVRVWYAPIAGLGGAHWPVAGFIYNKKPGLIDRPNVTAKPGRNTAPTTLTRFVPSKTVKVRFGNEPQLAVSDPVRITPARVTRKQATSALPSPVRLAPARLVPARLTPVRVAKLDARKDPIGAIIAHTR